MEGIREYLIGVVAAALLCGVVTALLDNKGMLAVAVKFLAGLLMILAVIRPWASISLDKLFDFTGSITASGEEIVSSGEKMAEEAYRASIKEQLESYILDEAKVLGCVLQVEVELADEGVAVPSRVTLTGDISPYARQTITTMLTDELGVKQEDQIWT